MPQAADEIRTGRQNFPAHEGSLQVRQHILGMLYSLLTLQHFQDIEKHTAVIPSGADPVAASCLSVTQLVAWLADSRCGGEWGDSGHSHGAVSPGQLLQAYRAGQEGLQPGSRGVDRPQVSFQPRGGQDQGLPLCVKP